MPAPFFVILQFYYCSAQIFGSVQLYFFALAAHFTSIEIPHITYVKNSTKKGKINYGKKN